MNHIDFWIREREFLRGARDTRLACAQINLDALTRANRILYSNCSFSTLIAER